MTGALSRLNYDTIVTTNLHSNNVQAHVRGWRPTQLLSQAPAERLFQPVCEYPAALMVRSRLTPK